MEYFVFSALFAVIHTVSYTVAGMIALPLSKGLYEGPDRVLDYLKDMADPFPCNIEGYVYMKDRYRGRGVFAKLQAEMLIYSVLLALAVSAFLF
jgi:hypothetical protein